MSTRTFEPGTVLIAHPELQDPFFGQSVILVLARGEDGGVIGANISGAPLKGPLFEGGPMPAPALLMLHAAKDSVESSRPLSATGYAVTALYPTAEGGIEPAGLLAKKPANAMVFLGYAGWGAGQLEAESQMGMWMPATMSLDDLIQAPSAERWTRAATAAGLIEPAAAAPAKPDSKPPTP
ncbi:MAG: YqgE/AlgH family protein [Alphaproteobacteria bacterium]|nr:MAG: YqgE/AlgH family protein [Alphaproteobacteria bacterium]